MQTAIKTLLHAIALPVIPMQTYSQKAAISSRLPECCRFCTRRECQLADQQQSAQMVAVAASAGAEAVTPPYTCRNTDDAAHL